MSTYAFKNPQLTELDGFRVELNADKERADIVFDRPPLNIVSMLQRDQLNAVVAVYKALGGGWQ